MKMKMTLHYSFQLTKFLNNQKMLLIKKRCFSHRFFWELKNICLNFTFVGGLLGFENLNGVGKSYE